MYQLFSIDGCVDCQKAELLLQMKSKQYEKIMLSREEMRSKGFRSAPQIFLGGQQIGGYDALRAAI